MNAGFADLTGEMLTAARLNASDKSGSLGDPISVAEAMRRNARTTGSPQEPEHIWSNFSHPARFAPGT